MKPNILVFDLETSPSIGAVFQKWETNVVWFEEHERLLMMAWKWLGEDEVYATGLPDYPSWKRSKKDDRALVKDLWNLLDRADIVIAHNGNSFDVKVANTFFLAHGLGPVSFFKSIDTKLVAKRHFRFKSNSLDDLGEYLGLGRKMETGGKELWRQCMAGNPEAWEVMRKYNIQDVTLLEKIYLKMLPFITNHPNVNLYSDEVTPRCRNCGSGNIQSRGFRFSNLGKAPAFKCKEIECGAWSQGKYIPVEMSVR